jgi:hypothetical protein
MATATSLLDEALKLPVDERVRVAEKLLESDTAWANEVQRRSRELKDGSVNGLSVDEARRIVASDPADDDR